VTTSMSRSAISPQSFGKTSRYSSSASSTPDAFARANILSFISRITSGGVLSGNLVMATAMAFLMLRRRSSRSCSAGSGSKPGIRSKGDIAGESAERLELYIADVMSAALNRACRISVALRSSSASSSASVRLRNSSHVKPCSRRHNAQRSAHVCGGGSSALYRPRSRRLGFSSAALCPP
jgi:hypothetical protein